MNTHVLRDKLKSRKAAVCVVGLGYVGLPTALVLADAGFRVSGFDIDAAKVSSLRDGVLLFSKGDPGITQLFLKVYRKMVISADTSVLAHQDIYLIAVATPLGTETKKVNVHPLKRALQAVGTSISIPCMVIIESTCAPGTAEKIAVPILERHSGEKLNEGFFLLHCPERISPGQTLANLTTYPRVIGVSHSQAGKLAKTLYESFCSGPIDLVDLKTAEVVKTAENADRDIRIALANEFAVLCDAYGVNFQKVRKLINKMPDKHILHAGAGVGGHCIPKDPWLFINNLKDKKRARLIPIARAVNDSMPAYITELLMDAVKAAGDRSLVGKKIAVLGYTYRENTDDTRDSPTRSLLRLLEQEGVRLRVHDPLVTEYTGNLKDVLTGAYAMVVMVGHDEYKKIPLKELKRWMLGRIIIDGRDVISKSNATDLGFIYRGIGNS